MKIRTVTPVKDEEVLLPLFLRHYGRFCDSIVIWDNGSTDRTLEIARAHPKVEVRSFRSDGFDTPSVLRVLNETRRESAALFDWCLFPDCDELVMSREPGAERDVLEAVKADVVAPVGFCLIERLGDPPFDPARDPLIQRRWGYPSPAYSKPIACRPSADFIWSEGRHRVTPILGCAVEEVDALLLLHLDMVDFNLWLRRKMRPVSAHDRARGWGVKRWDRPRGEYDALWSELSAQARDLGDELPPRLS